MNETEASITAAAEKQSKPLLTALPGSWPWAVAFLLSMSALGLSFYPALLVIIYIMANRFSKNRYDFIIQLTLLLGGFAIIDINVTVINPAYIVFVLGVACAFLLRKNALLRKAIVSWAVYSAVLLVFAFISEESMRVQFRSLLYYTLFIYFTVPVAAFAGKEFRFDEFVRAVLPYAITLSVFYILDAFVLSGWVLIPQSHNWYGGVPKFYDMMWSPLSGTIVRKYPRGLYMLTLLIIPLAREYRVRPWQWCIFILALMSTQTFTVISGFVLFFLAFQSKFLRVLKLAGAAVVAFVALYFIDGSMSYENEDQIMVSPMRIYSSIQQIVEVSEAVDDEDIAEFGSGRLAQALPKFELLYNLGYEWRGLGFLDKYETDNPKFIIENEYYLDQSESIEVATDIEVTVLQIIMTIGYIGLILHVLYFAYTWWIVRRLERANYYLLMVLIFSWFGLGGFEGLIFPIGLIMVALAFSVVYLSNKSRLNKTDASQ